LLRILARAGILARVEKSEGTLMLTNRTNVPGLNNPTSGYRSAPHQPYTRGYSSGTGAPTPRPLQSPQDEMRSGAQGKPTSESRRYYFSQMSDKQVSVLVMDDAPVVRQLIVDM